MSTRVHELAKELGLKSPDLLDRIQKWGLEVKPSALASLEPAMVDRIKELMDGPSPASPAPSDHDKGARTVGVTAPPSIKEPPIRPLVAEPRNPSPGATASATRPTPPTPATSEAPATIASPTTPAPTPAEPATPRPAAPRQQEQPPRAAPTGPHAQAPQPPAETAPARPAPHQRPATGPLSAHTPHRSGPGPAASPRPPADLTPRPPGPMPAAPLAPQRPGAMPPAPLQRSDYISPTGTRGGSPPPTAPRPNAGQPPLRRPDGPRPGGRPLPPVASAGGRPLPSVAPPTGPPIRRSDARPGPADGGKVHRPEKRFTPEELRAMMQAGQLGVHPPGPARPGAPRPGGGPARPGAPRPGGPGAPPRPGGPGAPRPGGPQPPGMAPLQPSTLAPSPAPSGGDDDDERRKGKAVGGASDRAGRRAKRNERAQERRVSSPVPAAALIEGEDEPGRVRRSGGKKHRGQAHRLAAAPARKTHVEIEPPITLRTLSEAIGVKANELIRKLMNSTGQLITINANLDEETAQMLALEFGVEIEVVHERTAEDDLLSSFETPEDVADEDREPRPPVITILGHVDHGKTSLLDKIRRSNVVASESGGITQHIGAYQVEHNGQKITFVDTPGHEAFTAMRARGANVTDIVVLVVAADDGVMPQTREAIAHAKAAGVPIVIALNKTDLPGINYNKIYGELSQEGLVPEEYGGDTPIVKTSALTGAGIPDLLEMLGIVAELRDLKGNPKRPATGTCLEASISEGRGVVATVLIQDGTLRVGDAVVCGDAFGRVRALNDDRGRPIPEAGPSTPVEISGLDSVPTAGEKFGVVDDITLAREIAETRRARGRGHQAADRPAITLENLYSKMNEQKVKTLNLILKADVQGSLEALVKELDKLENAEVPLRILHRAVGGIGESDVLLADASQAIIIGFRVAPEDRAISLAEEKKIDIRRYDIIYQVTDEIKKAIEGMLVPEIKEVHLGRAIVRQVFKISKVGAVAGCFVTQGTIERAAKVRLIREGREIYKGSLEALKRFKDDVREVREGFECGIKIANFDDIKNDDTIEAYRIDVIRRTL